MSNYSSKWANRQTAGVQDEIHVILISEGINYSEFYEIMPFWLLANNIIDSSGPYCRFTVFFEVSRKA